MKATIGVLLIGLACAGFAHGQPASTLPSPVGPQGIPPAPGGARFFNPVGPVTSPPAATGFYLGEVNATAPAQINPQSTIPSAPPPQPGGARFFNTAPDTNAPTTSGPSFQQAPAPFPVGLQASDPTLPYPQQLPKSAPMLPMPRIPMPPGTTPVVVDESMPPLADFGMSEPFLPLNRSGMRLPALGAWGAGVDSGERGPHLWFSADYLFWWVKNGPMPQPLVVTGPSTDDFPGALDQANTQILYGGKSIVYSPFSGSRLSGGLWCGPDHRFGFEMGGFILEQKSTHFAASGGTTGNPFIARPFINAQTGFENVYFVSQNFSDPTRTALMTGTINIANSSRMWSWETNGLWNVWRGSSATANLIGGFRSVGLRERFSVVENMTNLQAGGGVFFGGASVPPGNTVATFDKFDAENTFYGGQIGARFLIQEGRFSLNVTAKAALGVVQQLMVVDGATYVRNGVVQNDGRGQVVGAALGGVLAQATNMGRHFQNKLAVVPEGAFDLCYDVTDRLVVKLGYTFVYLSSVARPGDQIDRTINPAFVPTDFDYGSGGPARPAHPYKSTNVWTQGVNIGVEVRY